MTRRGPGDRLVLWAKGTGLKRDTLICREEGWVRRVMWVIVICFNSQA